MTIITNKRTIIAALVILALAFIYLSYEEGKKIKKDLNNEIQIETPEENEKSQNQQELDVSGLLDLEIADEEDFFIEYRLERDRHRAQEIEMLQTMFNSTNIANDLRQEALQKVLKLTNSLDQEMTLEALIVAKGYNDAVAFIQENQATVVVKDGEFNQIDAAKIADLVNRTTGIPYSKITVFARK